jgi:ectoine hydroxylase-related dioxygenase (phytanoyl-CoA dioxygenase family)
VTTINEQFDHQGFIVVPQLFSPPEMKLLIEYAKRDSALAAKTTTRSDAQGGETKLSLSNDLPDNLYSAVVRSRRVVDVMQQLLRDEVYHYHHKMMLKEPYVGGAWEWHQDYGYWYDYGCLFPTMGSCFVAVDACTRANGCLQVIPGSQQLGRLNHMKVGGQTGADPERVAAVLERMPIVHMEMQPGDAIFFHGNLLHRSDQNTSPNPRWSLICCYNTKANDPYKPSRHPNYSPLERLEDAQFLPLAERFVKQLPE